MSTFGAYGNSSTIFSTVRRSDNERRFIFGVPRYFLKDSYDWILNSRGCGYFIETRGRFHTWKIVRVLLPLLVILRFLSPYHQLLRILLHYNFFSVDVMTSDLSCSGLGSRRLTTRTLPHPVPKSWSRDHHEPRPGDKQTPRQDTYRPTNHRRHRRLVNYGHRMVVEGGSILLVYRGL